MMKKRGIIWQTLIPWIIVLGDIILVFILYFALSGKLGSMGEFLKTWLRFGR